MPPSDRLALIRTRVEAEAALVDADPSYERERIGKGNLPVRREDVEWLLERAEGEPLTLPPADERLAQIRERATAWQAVVDRPGEWDWGQDDVAPILADLTHTLTLVTDLTERLQVARAANAKAVDALQLARDIIRYSMDHHGIYPGPDEFAQIGRALGELRAALEEA